MKAASAPTGAVRRGARGEIQLHRPRCRQRPLAIAAVAVLIGLLLSLPSSGWPRRRRASGFAGGHGSRHRRLVRHGFAYWNGHYFVPGAAFALALGLALLAVLIVIGIARLEEIAAIVFGPKPRRLLGPGAPLGEHAPKVSIHIPACREPPEMLKLTLTRSRGWIIRTSSASW